MYYVTDNDILETFIDGAESSPNYDSALDILRRRRSTSINTSYQNEVDGRFSSNAIGSTKWYDSKQEDRNDLVGVVASGQDSYYKCFTSKTDMDSQWVLHTLDQLKTVLNDGRLLMIQLIQKKDTLLNDLKVATNKQEILNVVW